jgi:hypothetical protein
VTCWRAVEIGGRAKALDEGDSAGVGCATFQSRLLDQKAGDDPVDDLQQGREQLGMRGEGLSAQPPQPRVVRDPLYFLAKPIVVASAAPTATQIFEAYSA